jgi:hypothetical protein
METDLNSKKPGSNIDSWCGKCKMVLAHTIEAMVGDKPARVHCNTCKSQHTYRANAPGSSKLGEREASAAPARQTKGRATRYQLLLREKSAAVPKAYSPQDKYEAGDVVDHAMFGRGVTMVVKDGSKIEVLFESGPKTLIHCRP